MHNSVESPAVSAELAAPPFVVFDVLFIDDLAKILRTSRSTIERRRRAGMFPIPELASLDGRPRWSRAAVERYLTDRGDDERARRGRPIGRRRVN